MKNDYVSGALIGLALLMLCGEPTEECSTAFFITYYLIALAVLWLGIITQEDDRVNRKS